jgi:hypothetical protein
MKTEASIRKEKKEYRYAMQASIDITAVVKWKFDLDIHLFEE